VGERAARAPTGSGILNSATKPVPLEITRANAADVRIRWSDGHDAVYPAAYLRQQCPCARCQNISAPQDSDLRPLAIIAVGGYAIQFQWSDGHRAGVFAYDYLRGICPCPRCAGHGIETARADDR
jgi:DUF971 family protein